MRNFMRLAALALVALVLAGLPGCGKERKKQRGPSASTPPGPPDPTGFNRARGLNSTATVVAPALDGSGDVYVGGWFTTFGTTPANRIVRLNANGTVDPEFATGNGFDATVETIALANDGSGDVYVGGDFTSYDGAACNRIVRLNSNGLRDASFAIGTGFNDDAYRIAPVIDGSGDIYVGGRFSNYNGTVFSRIVRLNPDGSADPGFNVGTGFNSYVFELAPAVDGTGDLYVGGLFSTYRGSPAGYMARLNPDGSLDPGFAVGSGFNSTVLAIAPALDGSGDVYASAPNNRFPGMGSSNVVRLNANGTVDPVFVMDFGLGVQDIAVSRDGSGDVYLAGTPTAGGLARVNPDGTVDSGFVVGTGFNLTVKSVALAEDGSGDVHAGGTFTAYNGTAVNRIIRLQGNGGVDPSSTIGAGFNHNVLAIEPANDDMGSVYVGGQFVSYNGAMVSGLVRLRSNGTLDPTFATGTGFRWVYDLALAADDSGDLYVSGVTMPTFGVLAPYLIRLDADGLPDPGFSTGTGFNNAVGVIAPAIDESGDVYVGGSFSAFNGGSANRIIRLNSDGTADPGFSLGTGFEGSTPEVWSITPAGDGSGDIYVTGRFNTYNGSPVNGVVRLNADGSIDPGFVVPSDFWGYVYSVMEADDDSGDVYLAGSVWILSATPIRNIVRLNSDGTVDTAFDSGAGFDEATGNLAPAGDGSFYVSGYSFTSYDGIACGTIVRLRADGSMDPGFDTSAGFDDYITVLAAVASSEGGVYVGGQFTTYNGVVVDHNVKLRPDGTVE